jgi:hypothetical protein
MENLSPSNASLMVRILRDLQTGKHEFTWKSMDAANVILDKARYLDTISWSQRYHLQSTVDESIQTISIHNIRQDYLFRCTIALEANTSTRMNIACTNRQWNRNRVFLIAYTFLLLLGFIIVQTTELQLEIFLALGVGYYFMIWGEYALALQRREKFINQIFELFASNESYTNLIYKDEKASDEFLEVDADNLVTVQSSLTPEKILGNVTTFIPSISFIPPIPYVHSHSVTSFTWLRRDQSREWHVDYTIITGAGPGGGNRSTTKEFRGLLIPHKQGTIIEGEISFHTPKESRYTTFTSVSLMEEILRWAEVEQKVKEK